MKQWMKDRPIYRVRKSRGAVKISTDRNVSYSTSQNDKDVNVRLSGGKSLK